MSRTLREERSQKMEEARELLGEGGTSGFAQGLFFGRLQLRTVLPYCIPNGGERTTLNVFKPRVREFFAQSVDSTAIDREGVTPPEVLRGLHDLGVMTMSIPADLGGMGLSQAAYCEVMTEIGRHDGAIGVLVNVHQSIGIRSLMLFGSEEQRREWLPKLMRGETLGAFALTEPNAGSDAGGVETRAEISADGTHYILNGYKQWITNGAAAGFLAVAAKVPGDRDARGREPITAFLVTPDMPGFEVVEAAMDKCGIRGTMTSRLKFTNVAVPVKNVLGPRGKGLRVALTLLDYGRITFGATCTGAAQRCVEDALTHSKTRKQFGKSLFEFGLVKKKLARMAALLYGMEAATMVTAGVIDRGQEEYLLETAILKVYASEALWEILNDTIQLFGGRAYFRDLPYERMMRDARLNTIAEGANDVLRTFIALVGMRDVGNSLKEVLESVMAPASNLSKLGDFARKYLPGSSGPQFPIQHHHLAELAHGVETAAHQFGRGIEAILIRRREGVLDDQFAQGRVADAAISLYIAVCALVRLDHDCGDPSKSSSELTRDKRVGGYLIRLMLDRVRDEMGAIGDPRDAEILNVAEAL